MQKYHSAFPENVFRILDKVPRLLHSHFLSGNHIFRHTPYESHGDCRFRRSRPVALSYRVSTMAVRHSAGLLSTNVHALR